MTEAFSIVTLATGHDRTTFSCGVEALDQYFREQVGQDIKRRVTACFVALAMTTGKVAGYYTLAASGVPLGDLPEGMAKRLPRYPLVPVARVGRLAVDLGYRGQELGGALVWDAVKRSLRSEVAVSAVVVDAKDETAMSFYEHLGFVRFGEPSRQLVLLLGGFKDATGSPTVEPTG